MLTKANYSPIQTQSLVLAAKKKTKQIKNSNEPREELEILSDLKPVSREANASLGVELAFLRTIKAIINTLAKASKLILHDGHKLAFASRVAKAGKNRMAKMRAKEKHKPVKLFEALPEEFQNQKAAYLRETKRYFNDKFSDDKYEGLRVFVNSLLDKMIGRYQELESSILEASIQDASDQSKGVA